MTAFVLLIATVVGSSGTPVDFDNEVIPVLTKSGCNTGACHGSAAGRGGFKLSLYGGDPESDHIAIAMAQKGRRVNLAQPDESLVLLKPTENLEHGGGYRIEESGVAASLLQRWIAEGAKRIPGEKVAKLTLSPTSQLLPQVGGSVTLKATAHFSDRQTDVTQWTVFTAEDPEAVQIDSESGEAKALRPGRHIVIGRYLHHVVPIELIVPLSDEDVDFATETRANFIDERVLARLKTLRVPVSRAADDETFHRRITIDLTGRLPSLRAVRSFANDTSADKKRELVERLLKSEEFSEYWTLVFAKLLRIRSQSRDEQGARTYHAWLKQNIQEGNAYDDLVRQLVMATGDSHDIGPANFYRTVDGPRKQAEFVSELFMGSRLRCANCHNHPLDHWTQDDYHGLAAIFAKLERGQVIKVSKRGEVIHPKTGENAVPRIPSEYFLAADSDGRKDLAKWLTAPKNPYFAKATVNRLWKALMGRGLVEPVDDFRSTNPATHPLLLEDLARDFIAHGYDIRHTLRRIATSSTYARSAQLLERNRADDRFYSHALPRPLAPEVLADAIADVTGISDVYGRQEPGTRAVSLYDSKIASPALDILGRCSREESCETAGAESVGGLTRTLHLMNGELLNRKILTVGSRLSNLFEADEPTDAIIEEFYERSLARKPSELESRYWKQQIADAKSDNDRRQVIGDFLWSLLTCREFTTNH